MKAVLFDLMGVIITEGHVVKNVLDRLFPNRMYTEIKRGYEAFKAGSITEDEFWERMGENKRTEFISSFRVDSDVRELISYLKRAKYNTYLVTDLPTPWAREIVNRNYLGAYFDSAFYASELKLSKRSPMLYQQIKKITRAEASLMVDDKRENLRAASGAGMKTALVEREITEGFEPDAKVRTLLELRGYL